MNFRGKFFNKEVLMQKSTPGVQPGHSYLQTKPANAF